MQPAEARVVSIHYLEILTADVVSGGIHRRTNDVVEFACKELAIALQPQVVWIRSVPKGTATEILNRWKQVPGNLTVGKRLPVKSLDKEIKGGYTPLDLNEIWIQRDLDFPTLEFVAAHEVRHTWQKARHPDVFDDYCRAECDAYAYAYEALERYLEKCRKEDFTPEIRSDIEQKRESVRFKLSQHCPHVRFEAINA